MSVKTITITEDSYTRLSARKSPGESFSEVVCRITGGHSILELVGTLSKEKANNLEQCIREGRLRMKERNARIVRRMHAS